jgi:hypothetical protein
MQNETGAMGSEMEAERGELKGFIGLDGWDGRDGIASHRRNGA